VEGDTDRSLVEAVVQSRIGSRYSQVVVKAYRQSETRVINKELASLAHQGFDRLFLVDLNSSPCVTHRKEKIQQRYPALEPLEIVVVAAEIESWYLAGLSSDGELALRVSAPASTDSFTKEGLDRLRPARFAGPRPFLLELLKYFDWDLACQRNHSFAYLDRVLQSFYA